MSLNGFVSHGAAHALSAPIEPVVRGAAGWANNLHPNKVPDIETLFELAVTGWIPESYLPDAARYLGVMVAPEVGFGELGTGDSFDELGQLWNRVYWAKQKLPTVGEYSEIANRNLWTDETVAAGLQRWGFYGADVRGQVTNLRYDIPGPSDLVRFSVRHCWEPDLLQELGYDQEFPGKIIDYWHAAKGLDYEIFGPEFATGLDKMLADEGGRTAWIQKYVDAGVSLPTWAKMYWWSHWVLPSPSQGYLMWQRLNPLRNPKWDAPEMEGLNFGEPDLNLLLRANDYPPKYRPLLEAISRPIPGIRFVREFAKTGVYDYQDLLDWTIRLGYSPQDGVDIATNIWQATQKAEDKPAQCRGCAIVDRAYMVGVISADDAQANYVALGLTQPQAEERQAQVDLEERTRRATQVVASVRKRFLSGSLNANQARGLLAQFGIVNNRVNDYLADWALELQGNRKEIGAGQAVKWACQGIITIDELVTRLFNLGYVIQDVQGLIGQAELCAANIAAQQAAKIAKQQQQTLRQQQQYIKEQAALLKTAQRNLASHGTPAQLRKWYCSGILTKMELYERLNFLGWPDADVYRLIADCNAKQGKGAGGGGGSGG